MNSTLLAAILTAFIALASNQDGPVPPQRVDPASNPAPPSTEPVRPDDGRVVERQQAQQAPTWTDLRQTGRIDFRQPAFSTLRTHQPASIFTDEAYRRARVRSLLMGTLEQSR